MEVKSLIYTSRTIKKSVKYFIEGEYEVRIRIIQGKEKVFIPLGFSSSIKNWDENRMLPKPSHPYYRDLSKKIYQYLDDISFELKLAERADRFISCIEVKRRVLRQDIHQSNHSSQLKILEFFDKVIEDLEEAGNPGYADIFSSTRSTVSKLLNNNKVIPINERSEEKDKSFLAFTWEDHQKYEQLISAGSSESTISLYLRTYYRIWNLAITEGHCKKEHHPSKFIRFRAYKRIRTQKRSIRQEFLQKIIDVKFDPGCPMFNSHLLLQFMYYGRGINFGDMCKLKRNDIENGTIHYFRSKNHREYDYILHPRAQEIVEYFKSISEQSDAGYLFPILNATHRSPREISLRIKAALRNFNDDLKLMAISVGWQRKFTSYSLRHSFATHLRNNKVDISMIREALGHETEEQTVVYLDSLDDLLIAKEIDRALCFNKTNLGENSQGNTGIFATTKEKLLLLLQKLGHFFKTRIKNFIIAL